MIFHIKFAFIDTYIMKLANCRRYKSWRKFRILGISNKKSQDWWWWGVFVHWVSPQSFKQHKFFALMSAEPLCPAKSQQKQMLQLSVTTRKYLRIRIYGDSLSQRWIPDNHPISFEKFIPIIFSKLGGDLKIVSDSKSVLAITFVHSWSEECPSSKASRDNQQQ